MPHYLCPKCGRNFASAKESQDQFLKCDPCRVQDGELPEGCWEQIYVRIWSPENADLGCSPCAVTRDGIVLQDGPYGLLDYCLEHGMNDKAHEIETALAAPLNFTQRTSAYQGFRAELIKELPAEYE